MYQILGMSLYFVALALILTGAFLIWGWAMTLIVAGIIALLIGLIVYDL